MEIIYNNADNLENAANDAKSADVTVLIVGYTYEDEGEYVPPEPTPIQLSQYENLILNKDIFKDTDTKTISVDVKNTGDMDGHEIVQLYISAIGSKMERAMKELKALNRVAVKSGETKTVTLEFTVSDIAYYDVETEDFVVEPIGYEVIIGRHSMDDQALKSRFMISK